ncbi:MAG: site-specific integrase, partial [Aestuariivirga sp.]
MTNDLRQFNFADDVASLSKEWLATLKAERRLAAKTLEAYTSDIAQFGAFLQDHLGEPASAKALAELGTSDFRAFMAKLRTNKIESRSLARKLSAIRSFFRHAERNGHFKCPAIAVVRAPKISHSVPRPLTE